MKVGQLVTLLEHVGFDDEIVVVLTPDLIEAEAGGRVERPITFDLDRISVSVYPRPDRVNGDPGADVRTVLHLRP